MGPMVEPLQMYGTDAALPALDWSWARDRLAAAPTYWVAAAGGGVPHPRPVWGVWRDDDLLAVSLGTPANRKRLALDPRVVVHLDGSLDVVILEGRHVGEDGDKQGAAIAAYNAKYDWVYDVDQYGPLTLIAPDVVLSWQSEGFAGRDGFAAASRWRFG